LEPLKSKIKGNPLPLGNKRKSLVFWVGNPKPHPLVIKVLNSKKGLIEESLRKDPKGIGNPRNFQI